MKDVSASVLESNDEEREGISKRSEQKDRIYYNIIPLHMCVFV
jgi:hypothetical protein